MGEVVECVLVEICNVVKADEGVELDVLVAEANRDQSTYDGIDWGGERVADEVLYSPFDVNSD